MSSRPGGVFRSPINVPPYPPASVDTHALPRVSLVSTQLLTSLRALDLRDNNIKIATFEVSPVLDGMVHLRYIGLAGNRGCPNATYELLMAITDGAAD